MNICIIPARGGSKRIPRKNVRDFCGKPMISWSIEAALQSGLFERVIVSTDCQQIAKVAREHGAWVPFVRPAYLSDDHTPTIPVIRHAIDWLTAKSNSPRFVCCLYATAPFVQANDLKRGMQILQTDSVIEFAFSVTAFAFPVQRALLIDEGRLRMVQPEHELTRSQDLPETWHDAGQFYWGTPQAFANNDGFFSARSAPVKIPLHRVQDIDKPQDWTRAELIFRTMNSPSEAA